MSNYGRPYRRRQAELGEPWGMPCPFCSKPMLQGQRLQTDHVVPVHIGGADGPLRWAHGKCNEAEGAKLGNLLRGRPPKPTWNHRWA